MVRKYLYLCIVKLIEDKNMNQSFIHILLCGIIILLASVGGSEYRA